MPASELDLVLDALSGLLRDFGRHAFDLSRQDARKTQALFEQWAQHVVIGSEAPTRKGPVAALAQRHFTDLRQFFVAHRKTEQSEVNAAQDALRDVVWTFVSSLNRVTHEDQADDRQVGSTLSGLVSGLEHAAPQDFRKLALDAVRAVQGVLEVRRERQQKQVAEMSQKLETLGSQLEIARRESTTDGLTHLFNRRAFDDQLPRCAELARLRSIGAALLIIDVDHFKKVNDTWGHPAGDAVLRSIAHETIRVFKRKGDFVARYGGEELAVLLTDVDYRETTSQAEKVRGAIAQMPLAWEGAVLNVTASVGGALWRADEPNEAWLARADAALYAAKHTGRNRVSISE